jgi:uncharacterized coiled-coil DUF342 family protein
MDYSDQNKKLSELEIKASDYNKKWNVLFEESKKCAEKRNLLNFECNEIKNEIINFKAQRYEYFQKICELKKNRVEILTKLKDKQQTIIDFREEIGTLKFRVSQSGLDLQQQINGLDWKIQTTRMERREEEKIIKKIFLLEKELEIHRKIDFLQQKVFNLHHEVDVLDVQAKNIHTKMSNYVNKRQKCYEKILNKKNIINKKKISSNQAHQRFLEFKEKAEENRLKYSEIIKKIKKIEEQSYKEQRNHLERTREEMGKTAKDKLRATKKLTFEEFKLLMEKGLV